MTAIRDALTKAGVDTSGAELRTKATEALLFHRGDIAAAANKLWHVVKKRDDLGVAAMREIVQQQASSETVTKTLAKTGKKVVAVNAHQRHRRRTSEEREAALRVAGQNAEVLATIFEHRIDGRQIGDIQWGELRRLIQAHAEDAAGFLELGHESTRRTLLLLKIYNHTQVDDPSTPIKRVIAAKQLQKFMDEAEREAPIKVRQGKIEYKQSIVIEHREGGA